MIISIRNVYLATSLFEKYSFVAEKSNQRALLRHLPLLIPTAVWILLFAGLLRSEVLRAVLAIACIGLMLYQWRLYRRLASGARFIFLSLVVAGLSLASLWLALNVVRFYNYDGGSGRIYGVVVSIQHGLVWMTAALLLVVAVWAIFDFARWLTSKCRILMNWNP